MTVHDGEAQASPMEELVFLARSRHRVQLLGQLSDEERTRRELHDATGISQPTLGRILGDFERRRWVSNNHDGTYALTALGALLADEVDDLLGLLGTIERLAEPADHLPFERLDFDLRHLSDATVTTPSSTNPLAHMRRFDELAGGADHVRVLSNVLSCAPAHEPATADREFLADVDELVVPDDALAGIGDAEFAAWLSERTDEGDITLYGTGDPMPVLLGIFDGVVGIVPVNDAGMPVGLIETASEPVLAWARDAFEEYRGAASRLAPNELSTPAGPAAGSG